LSGTLPNPSPASRERARRKEIADGLSYTSKAKTLQDIGHFAPKPMISVIPAQAGIQEILRDKLDARLCGNDGYSWLHRTLYAGME
jgi:hypothetical protein